MTDNVVNTVFIIPPKDISFHCSRYGFATLALSKGMVILFSVSFVLAQVLVKGTVKDNLGEGVPGASVQVKGTSQGTITDLDGKFAFNVPNKNSILVISFIGYVTVEIKADTQKPMVITLKEDTKTLDEVVVVGYQEIHSIIFDK